MDTLVSVHSMLRWVVLLAGVVALVVALVGWLGSAASDRTTRQAMLIYAVSLDVQVLLGIVIWVLGNYWQSEIRQFKFEHPITMLLALIVAHVAAARARRAPTPTAAARGRAIGAAVSLLTVLIGIPWNR
jgi:hypothetical protein